MVRLTAKDGLSIPVSSDGAAYTNIAVLPYLLSPITASRGFGGWEGNEWNPDSLHYGVQFPAPTRASALLETSAIKDLKAYAHYFSGKIVVINWMNDNTAGNSFDRMPVATVISSVLRNTLYKKIDGLTYLFMVAGISILALISVFFNKRWMIVAAIVLMIGVTAFAWWMVFSYRVIFDPLYPIAAIAVASVIYSLLRYTREAA